MSTTQPTTGPELIARLDRIPIWPYPTSTLWIIGAGFFFAFFDIVTIGFALPVLTREFGVSEEQATWAVTSGLIGYILGSFLDSRIGDRYGRRISLYLSVGAFSLGSLLSATSTTLDQLLFWRFVSGMGIGAEIALVTTYMAECSPAPLRGRFTGWTIVAAYLGFAAVPLLAFHLVPEYTWGWRALFLMGALGGIAIGFMRKGMPDSLHWLIEQGRLEEAQANLEAAEVRAESRLGRALPPPAAVTETPDGAPESAPAGIRALFLPPYRSRLLILASLWFVYYVGNYAWLTLAAELFSKHGLSLSQTIGSLSFTGFGFVAGAITAVYISDRVDRRVAAAATALVWAAILAGIGFTASATTIPVLGFIASFTIGLIVPLLYTITGESFATGVRATGVSLSDGIGHLGGAFCGQIVFAVEATAGFSGAFLAMAATGLLSAGLVMLTTRNTGRALNAVERRPDPRS
jgi:putative MFS transporter